MAKTDWSKVKREYVTGNISLKDLAEKHNVNINTMHNHIRDEHWSKERKEYRQKFNQKAIEKTLEKNAQAEADDEAYISRLKADIRKLAYKRIYKDLNNEELEAQDVRRAIQNFKDMVEIEPNGIGEEYEDDGLLTALAEQIEDVFAEGDDSALIGGD